MRRTRTRSLLVACALLGAALLLMVASPRTAHAQSREDEGPLDTQRFRPHATSDGLLSLEGANPRFTTNPFGLGVYLHYAHQPLVVGNDDGDRLASLVSGQLAIDLTASWAFASWFELGVHLPTAALFAGDPGEPLFGPYALADSTFALGDIRLVPKFTFLDDRLDGFGLALIPELWLPSHTDDFYGGARMVTFRPRLVLDHRFARSGFRILGNIGAVVREVTEFLNVTMGQELELGLGLAYRFDMGFSPFELALEAHNAIGLTETDSEEISLEVMAAAQIYLGGNDWRLTLGGGVGALEGYGTPNFRLLAGIRWEPSFDDRDDDGIGNDDALDDYQNPDKDGDGKVDSRYDEDGDGKIDEKYDQDGDGKIDEDKARQEMMEDYRNPDKDGDGKVDSKYDKDGDGKIDPEYDKDGDGRLDDEIAEKEAIADGVDLCPDLPEDYDGIEDDDGCPEGDEDGDGVLDMFDRCPDAAETINGFEDDDGCPDEGPAQVIVDGDEIRILATIRFKTNSDELTDDSKPIMDQLVLTMRARQDIKQIRIEGHTDSTGPRDFNMKLSKDRAESVKRYMVERGIKSSRLQTEGFGPDRPIASNDTADGREQNRRVEFKVIQR